MNSSLILFFHLTALLTGTITGLADAPRTVDASRTVYVYQLGTPAAIQNFILPEAGCNWSGIGGQIFNPNGVPNTDLTIRVTGTLEGSQVFRVAVAGTSLQWGPGGFSIMLTDHPAASQGTLHLQLFDATGVPVSSQIPFNTYSTCDKNLVLVNLVLATFKFDSYLPLVHRRIP